MESPNKRKADSPTRHLMLPSKTSGSRSELYRVRPRGPHRTVQTWRAVVKAISCTPQPASKISLQKSMKKLSAKVELSWLACMALEGILYDTRGKGRFPSILKQLYWRHSSKVIVVCMGRLPLGCLPRVYLNSVSLGFVTTDAVQTCVRPG